MVNLLFQQHGFRKVTISEPGQKGKKCKEQTSWDLSLWMEGWGMEDGGSVFGCWFACWLCVGVGRWSFASAHLLRFFCIDEFLFVCAFFVVVVENISLKFFGLISQLLQNKFCGFQVCVLICLVQSLTAFELYVVSCVSLQFSLIPACTVNLARLFFLSLACLSSEAS